MALELLSGTAPKIRGVLFDMDGVVIDSERLFTRFWVEAAQDLGFPMTREQALGLRSLGAAQGQPLLSAWFGPTADYNAIRARRIELMESHIALHGIDAKPGIYALLDRLDELNIPRAITSSSALDVIRLRLQSIGLGGRFQALCSGKDVPHGKPAPDIYLRGAASLGLPPEVCLAIEDSPTGVLSAHRAGCPTVIVPDQDQPTPETLRLCRARADSLEDLLLLFPR